MTQRKRSTARSSASRRCASTQLESSPSRRASSPLCGVKIVGAARWNGCSSYSASASTTAGSSVSSSKRRTSGCWSRPRPGPSASAEARFAAAERASARALGPGLGRDQQPLVRRLLEETELPAVVDADALYELQPFQRAAPTILTPHSGELARLLGEDSSWVDAHRLEALERAVDRFRCVILLKGADTLVGAQGEGVWVVGENVPALATAGTGDVLTGIAAAFLAKGMGAREAAAAAALLHRRAARSRERGLVAGDLVDALW